MTHVLPPLPYSLDALAPYISKETLEYHYGKHHQTYVNNLNKLLEGTADARLPLAELLQIHQQGPIFNNAAQVWNHTFYWHCLTPPTQQPINHDASQALTQAFGSVEQFKKEFLQAAMGVFGSGWAWLVKNLDNSLAIVTTSNAGTPSQNQQEAILCCDVWEHAYYIDYRNNRQAYTEEFWQIINWDFVANNLNA